MARVTVWTIIGRVLLVPVVLVGAAFASIVIYAHVHTLPVFLQARNTTFWDDLTAFDLRRPDAKTLDQFYREYEPEVVREFILESTVFLGLVPSGRRPEPSPQTRKDEPILSVIAVDEPAAQLRSGCQDKARRRASHRPRVTCVRNP